VGLVLFRLLVPPLQSGVVGSYLVWGIWFSSRLLLQGTGPYPDFFAITGGPRYPGYKTPTVAPEPFVEWVAGAVHSTGQNRYSYVTMGTTVTFYAEGIGLKPSWL
jgi:hypothetical protein